MDEVESREVTHWITAAEKRTDGFGQGWLGWMGEGGRTVAVAAHEADPAGFAVEGHEDGEVSAGYLSVGVMRERVGDGVHDTADEGADAADKGSGGNGSEATVAFGLLHVSEGV